MGFEMAMPTVKLVTTRLELKRVLSAASLTSVGNKHINLAKVLQYLGNSLLNLVGIGY